MTSNTADRDSDRRASGFVTPPVIKLAPIRPDNFVGKTLDLIQPVKIGRQVSAGDPPLPHNGIFNSPVLSRNHALIFFESGKVYIKDTRSSNGTYLNGNRLSAESTESAIHELHSGDILEFGVDFADEETPKVVHAKISALLTVCYSTYEDSSKNRRRPDTALSNTNHHDGERNANLSGREHSDAVYTSRQLSKVLEHLNSLAAQTKDLEIAVSTLTKENGELQRELRAALKSELMAVPSTPAQTTEGDMSTPAPLSKSRSSRNNTCVFLVLPLIIVALSILLFLATTQSEMCIPDVNKYSTFSGA